jgi:hypothetical protein
MTHVQSGPSATADPGVARRRRGQARGPHRRHHPQAAARRAGRRQPLLHDAELQQAQHHAEHEERRRARSSSPSWSRVRRARWRTSGPAPSTAWASRGDRSRSSTRGWSRLDQGLRRGPRTRTSRLRGGRAGDGRLDERPPASRTARRWPPARRSATPAPACTPWPGILAALLQRKSTGRGQRVTVGDAARRAQPVPREAARPAAAARTVRSTSTPTSSSTTPVPRSGQRLRRRAARLGGEVRPGGPDDYIYVIVQPPGWAPISS